MDLFENFKRIRDIKPDEEYSKRSRAMILSSPQKPRLTWKDFITRNFRIGSAVALTGVLVALIWAGFFALNRVAPTGLASLDPAGLQAEAQAVDIQLQLAKLNYQESSTKENSGIASRSAGGAGKSGPQVMSMLSVPSAATEDSSTTSSSTTVIGIDQALDELSN
jgi:hypothetical protein